MHSSRMFIVRSSSRLPGGGGSVKRGMSASGPGGGVCLWSRRGVSQHSLGQTPPSVNIIFLQLRLRTVKMGCVPIFVGAIPIAIHHPPPFPKIRTVIGHTIRITIVQLIGSVDAPSQSLMLRVNRP